MKSTTSLLMAGLLSTSLLAGCAAGTRTATSAQSPKPAPSGVAATAKPGGDKPATKTIAELTKTARKHDGLFTVYQDTLTGALHLLVREDQLGKEFIYFTQTSDGVVAAGHFRGQFRDNNVFSVRKHFNRIEFVTENTSFYFDAQNALSRAASANISPAIVAVQEIAATDSAQGLYLINASDLFLTESLSQVKPSPNPTARPGESFALGNLSKAKTKVVEVKNYPLNTMVVVDYVYENPAPLVGGGAEVTDARNVTIRAQHTLIEVPADGYHPRFDDARVGYFTQQVNDMTSASATPFRDVINRWHLVKKDPGAAVSEPVEPIVWWIENTTPVELRQTIADAVLAWNEAFEAAGFRNAVQVQIQPDDADWDAGDIRYNVLRWTSSPTPPFGGYGPSFVNPRTGQILGADIMLEYIAITNVLRNEKLFDAAALNLFSGEERFDGRFCAAGLLMQENTLFGMQALKMAGAPADEQSRLLKSFIYFLVLHEVGHTLGLNHNMKSSQMLSPEELQDASVTAKRGVTGSVMDYPAVNLAPSGGRQADYYTMKPGPYDLWAIEFGYAPALSDPAAEQARLAKLLARSTEPALAFGNDADDMRAPGKAIDPRVMINDMSSDAIGYAVDRIELSQELMKGIRRKYAGEGQSYHELRNAYLILTGQQAGMAGIISRYVGGVYVDRAVVGQPNATRPFTPVSLKEQKRAMDALARYLFAPDAFDAPAELYDHLQMQRRGFEFFQAPEDPKIHARALSIQKSVLAHLLHPNVLARLTDTQLYGNEYSATEMLSDLTEAVFAADARGPVNTFRQNLQLDYVNQLAAMLKGPAKARYDYPAQSAALYQLKSIQKLLAGKSGPNAETRAHTGHVLFAIEQALAAE